MLAGVVCRGGFGIAGDAKAGQAPSPVEQQDVVGLDVTVDDRVLKVFQGLCDVAHDDQCVGDRQGSVVADAVGE